MNAPNSEDRELLDLLAQHFAGELTEESKSRLQDRLRTDAAARQLFRHYALIVAGIHWELADSQHGQLIEAEAPLPTASPLGRELGAERQANAAKLPVAPPPTRPFALPSRSPVLGFLAPITRRIPGGEATVGGLVVLVLIAAFWGLAQKIMHPNLGGRDLAEDSSPLPTVPPSHRPNTVATITDTADVEWSRDTSSPLSPGGRGAGGEGDAVRAGQPLSIQSGLVELELAQGTKLLIEGPAEWTIDGNNNATLRSGKLFANVPKQAIGFTLQTPTTKIVDLGTEFGVDVGETGITQVAVRSGVVECSRPNSSQPPISLRKGEALRISSNGDVAPTPCDLANFVGLATESSNQPLSGVPNDPALWVYEPFTETRDGVPLHHRHEGLGFRVIQWVASEAAGGDGLPIFCIRNDLARGADYFPGNVPFKGTPGVFEHRANRWGLERATRKMVRSMNLAQDGEYFLSFVGFKYRVNSQGMVGLFSREAGQGIEAGWKNSGNGDDDPFALASPGQLKKAAAPELRIGGNAETVFFVLRIVASADKPDAVYLKAYRSTDTAHESPELLRGEGPGPDQWSVVLPEFRSDLNLDQLSLAVDGPEAYIHIDEIRLGTTWEAVTGVMNE